MHPYTFSASLRIHHPSLDLAAAAEPLGISPKRTWVAGAPRLSLEGLPLEGTYPNSYWYANVSGDSPISSEIEDLESFLGRSNHRFSLYADTFAGLIAGGGRVEFFIGLYGTSNFGFTIDRSLIAKLSESHIELAFDVYP